MVNSKLKHKQFQLYLLSLGNSTSWDGKVSLKWLSLWRSFKTPTSLTDQSDFFSSGHLPRGYATHCLCQLAVQKPEPKRQNSNVLEALGLYMHAVPTLVRRESTEAFWVDPLGLPGAPPHWHGAADMVLETQMERNLFGVEFVVSKIQLPFAWINWGIKASKKLNVLPNQKNRHGIDINISLPRTLKTLIG